MLPHIELSYFDPPSKQSRARRHAFQRKQLNNCMCAVADDSVKRGKQQVALITLPRRRYNNQPL